MRRFAFIVSTLGLVPLSCSGTIELASNDANIEDGGAIRADAPDAVDRARLVCTNDGECGRLHCDPSSSVCVACTIDAHCASSDGHRCDAAIHRCVECGVESDCKPGESCQPETRQCVPACGDGGTCPTDAPICDTLRRFCLECRLDTDCGETDRPRCDATHGRCVACRSNAECGAAQEPLCDPEGRCVECLTSLDCPSDKPFCEPDTWECRA